MKGQRHKRGIVVREDEEIEIDVKLENAYLIDKNGNKYSKKGDLVSPGHQNQNNDIHCIHYIIQKTTLIDIQ